MTDYFNGYEIVAETKNFMITCEDDFGARSRAQSIAGACESDLAALNDLFSTNFEAGKTSDYTIWVVVTKDDPAVNYNGLNYGYETEESSRIFIAKGFVPPPPTPPPANPPAVAPPNLAYAVLEFPRFVFVAELAEILMDFTGYGWGAGNSMGEGLSNVLGTLLHPAGYYSTGQGPRVNQWLNGGGGPPPTPPRKDYVGTTENTDRNIFSYGCSILFINYLVSQRGYSMKNVIRAGGGTLAETYARLTAEPASAAYNAFNNLLQNHIGSSTNNNVSRDNIFPLLDPQFRSVEITTGDNPIDLGTTVAGTPVKFKVKPGLMCPVDSFDFYRQHQQIEQPVYARARGFATAAFRWSVNGTDLIAGSWKDLTVPTEVTVRNPEGKKDTIAASAPIQYLILDSWNGSALYINTFGVDGNFSLDVSAAAKEKAMNDPEASATDSVGLITVSWLPSQQLKDARKSCNPFYAKIDTSLWGLSRQLADAKNRPDPPSDPTLLRIVQAVHQLDAAVEKYAKAGHMTQAEVWKEVGTPNNGLRSAYELPAEVDLTRLRGTKGIKSPQQ